MYLVNARGRAIEGTIARWFWVLAAARDATVAAKSPPMALEEAS